MGMPGTIDFNRGDGHQSLVSFHEDQEIMVPADGGGKVVRGPIHS